MRGLVFFVTLLFFLIRPGFDARSAMAAHNASVNASSFINSSTSITSYTSSSSVELSGNSSRHEFRDFSLSEYVDDEDFYNPAERKFRNPPVENSIACDRVSIQIASISFSQRGSQFSNAAHRYLLNCNFRI